MPGEIAAVSPEFIAAPPRLGDTPRALAAMPRPPYAVRREPAAAPGLSGRELAEVILAESRRTGLGPGGRLPTERRLAADLGTTRASVRRALAVLEAKGSISREVGRGTFLREVIPDPAAPAADGGVAAGPAASGHGPERSGGFAPADVMTIRRLLEPSAMQLVVAWATATDFEEIGRCLSGGNRAASYEEFETWDLALHRSIMAASHSPLLAMLYGMVETARHGFSWGDLKRRSTSAERREQYQQDHRDIVAGLRARDADLATEAMRIHLNRVTGHLLREAR